MYTVLVPVDTSVERGLNQAKYVNSLPGAPSDIEVIVTHIIDDPKMTDAPPEMREPSRVKAVRKVIEYLKDNGYATTTKHASAPPTNGINELAEQTDANVIVMGGRKRSPTGKAIFGSVTQSVILNTNHPVVVAGDKE